MDTNEAQRLGLLYYTPREPSSFGGINALQRHSHSKDFQKWLKRQDTYTLHKPARRNYTRNKTKVAGIDDQWQADLVDMKAYSKYNKKYNYILTVIDIFSKYAWAVKLKKKTGDELVKALKKIFKSGRQPLKFNTDQGTEFENTKVKTFLKKCNIHFFTTRSDKKAAVVERFNRTLKTKMWRYFTFKHSYTYCNILDDLLEAYNNSKHRSIGMAPSEVNNTNENRVYLKLYGVPELPAHIHFKFQVGDTVRISKQKAVFDKGYLPNWTEELFTIYARYPRTPPVYKIKDYDGSIIEGTFYEPELQKVEKLDDTYIIEKVLRKEKRHGKEYALVKWRGYPSSMNSWVAVADLISL